ncbi:MAG: O-antigen ligase family protein, partial [Chthoniobacterales bacterium]
LVQKATGAVMPLWAPLNPGERPVSTFFATYYYHGNAGAFLNLVLPAVLGLAFRYVTRPANPGARALWLTMSVIMVVAVFSDTSRMGQAVAALMMITLLMLATAKVIRRLHLLEWKTVAIALLAGGLALWAVVQTSHLDRSLGRWDRFQSTWTKDARWLVDGVAVQALPQAGALGFGPGTFSAVFPSFLEDASKDAHGTWLFLHDDYLQTLLEWGWVGGVLWAGVFFGGMLVAVRGLADKERVARWFPRQRLSVLLALSALAGVAVHAAVDFPLQIFSIQLYAATWLGVCWGSGGFGRLRRRG